jgi:hypothetical protein
MIGRDCRAFSEKKVNLIFIGNKKLTGQKSAFETTGNSPISNHDESKIHLFVLVGAPVDPMRSQ